MPDMAAADRLYTVPPREFVAERSAAVDAARAEGDTAAAAALGKLRRPTVAAWLVNLLALRRPELLSELAELAAGLRSAQRDLDGDRLRELATQRRAAVAGLVDAARSLALAADPSLAAGKLPLAEVETTLTAALADDEVAGQVRSGRLVRAVAPDGFGELPRARLRLVTGGDGDRTVAGEPGEATRAAVEGELVEARAAAEAAGTGQERATAAEREAKQELAEIDAELAELATRRATAATRLKEAEAAILGARRAVAAARRRLGDAEAAKAVLDAETGSVSG